MYTYNIYMYMFRCTYTHWCATPVIPFLFYLMSQFTPKHFELFSKQLIFSLI